MSVMAVHCIQLRCPLSHPIPFKFIPSHKSALNFVKEFSHSIFPVNIPVEAADLFGWLPIVDIILRTIYCLVVLFHVLLYLARTMLINVFHVCIHLC